MENILFSIITVCYNCEDKIRKTIESLKNQDFNNYEYVIIDGASTDTTFSIVKEYEPLFSQINTYSENDNGIYDAMNKGIMAAKGEYIYFLNAGDIFYDNHVLSDMATSMYEKRDIYYGKALIGDMVEQYPKRLSMFYLIWREKMVCHQSIFAKRFLFNEIQFDTKYKVCADRKWIIDCLKQGATYKYVSNVIVCRFEEGGVSRIYKMFDIESTEIARTYVGCLCVLGIHLKRLLGSIFNA